MADAGNRETLRRVWADFEAGHLKVPEFFAAVEAAGYTVTPKARQMALVTGGATFQAFLKSLSSGGDHHAHVPANQVQVTQVDQRKHGENARFVVQRRRALDVMNLPPTSRSGSSGNSQKAYTASGYMPGMGAGNPGSGAVVQPGASMKDLPFMPKQNTRQPRGEHATTLHIGDGSAPAPQGAYGAMAANGSSERLTKRMQAQKLATELTAGRMDQDMFRSGLRALGLSGDAASEPMRLATQHLVGGGIPLQQLTRAITMQLA